jgi:hypothetical protein
MRNLLTSFGSLWATAGLLFRRQNRVANRVADDIGRNYQIKSVFCVGPGGVPIAHDLVDLALWSAQYIAQKVMHPCRESVHAAVQILNHGGAMIGMAEDDAQLCADAFTILR